MRRWVWRFAGALGMGLILSWPGAPTVQEAQACKCEHGANGVEFAKDFDQVFLGVVLGTLPSGCNEGMWTQRTRFKVEEAFVGVEVGEVVVVKHRIHGPACGRRFDQWDKRVVYAFDGYTSGCSTFDPGDNQAFLRDLRAEFSE